MFGANNSSYEALCLICLGVTFSIWVKSQVFGMINRLKDLAMKNIQVFNGVSGTVLQHLIQE